MIGERIRGLRKQKGLTLEQVAQRSGFSRSYVSEIETGKRPGSIEAVTAIADSLGAPLDQIFSAVGMEDAELELLHAFRALDPADRSAVLRHAQALMRDQQLRRILK